MANLTNAKGKAVKSTNGEPVRQSGFGRGAASNWEAFGEVIKLPKNFTPQRGFYEVREKDGKVEMRRYQDSNGTGQACLVYRVAAKKKQVEAPVKATKKPVAKKEVVKAPAKGKAQAKATKPAKAKAVAETKQAKKGNAKKGK